MNNIPEIISNEPELEEILSRPGSDLVKMISNLDGDILFLGVGGKIGPSLAQMSRRAAEQANVQKRIVGVSLFESDEQRRKIEQMGIETIHGDLLDTRFINELPDIKNVFFLAGMKFGSEENLSVTWAVNSFLPGLIAERFKFSRIVAFSTGCVYPLVKVNSGGSIETDTPCPIGEYAQSCLGRERMFEYGSNKYGTHVTLVRLNYSVEMRYGVLVDIATKVKNEEIIDLSMGHFNVIWQGDVNDMVLRSLEYTNSPAKIMNITGPEILSVREVAQLFAKQFGVEPKFEGKEAPTALLSNAKNAFKLFGRPTIPVSQIISWISGWMKQGLGLLGKPTHYEVRDGKY